METKSIDTPSCSDSSEIFSHIITDIQKNAYKPKNSSDTLVIADTTHSIANSHIVFSISPTDTSFIMSKLSTLELTTVEDFWEINQRAFSLPEFITLDKNQLFESEVNEVSRFTKLSSIGFNKQCDQALITYFYFCGETCGYQKFIVLQKKDSHWRIEEEIITGET